MQALFQILALVLHRLFKLLAMGLLAALVLGLLLGGICIALLSVLWSLLRGKRPAMVTVFHSVRQAARPFAQSPFAQRAGGANAPRADDVVDVQAHEVRQSLGGHNGKNQD